MKPAPFSYHRAATTAEAAAILAEVAPEGGRILAGGQSLVPSMAFRLATPSHLVDIHGIGEIGRIERDGDTLAIGACVHHVTFQTPVAEGPLGPFLGHVARHIGHLPVRERGTFGGSLAQADPASEWCLVAVTLGASLTVTSTRETREIAADEFIRGIMDTALADDEILTGARLPLPAAGTRLGFAEFSRRAGDFALAMAMAAYREEDGTIREPRLGIGGVEERPRRMAEAERAIEGQPAGAQAFAAAAEAAADAVDPMEDHATSAAYRRDLVRALARRALERAAA